MQLLETLRYKNILLKVACVLPVLIAFTIPLPIRINSVTIAWVCSITTVTAFVYGWLRFKFLKTPLFLLMGSFFLLLCIGLLHTNDLYQGLRELEKNVTILVFAIAIYQWKLLKVKTSHLLWGFTLGCLFITLYGFLYCAFALEPDQRTLAFSMGHSYYSQHIKLHPTYLAVYFIIIIFFLVETLRSKKTSYSFLTQTGIYAIVAYALFMLFFLQARIAIAGLFLSLLIYISLFKGKKFQLFLITTFVLGILTLVFFHEQLLKPIDRYTRNASTALEGRVQLWEGVIEGIALSPVVGAGTGSSQELIDEGFLKTGYDEGLDNEFNAHNQYLESICRNGLIELVLLVAIIFYSLRTAVHYKDRLYFIFIITMAFSMLTESMLDTQKGIIFFYFFSFSFYFLKEHE